MVCTHIAPKKMIGSDMRSMVDLKGIEPSNLTDANRALSQLSYRPKYLVAKMDSYCIIADFYKM